MDYTFPRALYDDIISLVSGIVVKREDLAKNAETVDTYRNFERYLACVNGSRYFHTFARYDLDILKQVFPPAEAARYFSKPSEIPVDRRDAVVKLQAERVLESYVEENEYYRMLNGLPPLNASRTWIYVNGISGIDPDTPIHELTPDQISVLELNGRLADIMRKHPGENFEYLKYLGSNSIGIVRSRLARPFDILRLGVCSSSSVEETFRREYMYARRYVLANFYNRDLFTTKELYDPIIGILILTLAMRNTMVPDERAYLNYDEVLDTILESYGLLKYFKKFPFIYKRRIVMALDKLLAAKGTDGVIVDVCKLFSPDDLVANRYYLMKYQQKDDAGDVIVTGDPSRDYELEFLKTPILTHDTHVEDVNRVPYSMTDADYLWQIPKYDPDGNLTEGYSRLLNENFNLLMSKYVDAESAYDLSSLVFELCCFTNLLLKARENLGRVSVVNVYATGGKCSLFTMLIFLLDAMAKRSNFDGNIVYDPENVGEVWTRYNLPDYQTAEWRMSQYGSLGRTEGGDVVWRFNYGDIADELNSIIEKYNLTRIGDETLLENGFEMSLARPEGSMNAVQIMGVYLENRELYEAICKEMNEAKTVERYEALLRCRNLLFTSASECETFRKLDGTPASTYHELLMELDPRLARKVNNTGGTPEERELAGDNETILNGYDEELNGLIVYILEKLENLFNSGELHFLFLGMPSVYSSLIGHYIMTAIDVFKASSVQFRNVDIFFRLGDGNPIRVFDRQGSLTESFINDEIRVIDKLSADVEVIVEEYVTGLDKAYANA